MKQSTRYYRFFGTISLLLGLLMLSIGSYTDAVAQSEETLNRKEVRSLRQLKDAESLQLIRSVLVGNFILKQQEDTSVSEKQTIVKVKELVPIEVEKVIYVDTCFVEVSQKPKLTNRELRNERKITRIEANKEIRLATIDKDKEIALLKGRVDSINTLLNKQRRLALVQSKVIRDTVERITNAKIRISKDETKQVKIENRFRWFHVPLMVGLLGLVILILWIIGQTRIKL